MNTERFHSMLIEERVRVLHAIGFLDEEMRELQRETGDESQDEVIGGGASFTLDREIDKSLDENSRHILRAIDEALERISEGTYGICVRCAKPITEARLEAAPHAAECIDCKNIHGRL